MLTMTGMPVADILDYIFSGIKITVATLELSAIIYMLAGGWVDIIRSISFYIDDLLVGFIGTFYKYFIQIINGTIFTKEVINSVMNRLYVFIGIIVFFKLCVVIIKYINNPELVSDSKAGVNSLVKRVIFGFALMIFIPTIFNLAMDLQAAIIEDKVIEKIILPEKEYLLAETTKDKAGYIIGMNILQGFWNTNTSASGSAIRNYKNAIQQNDPSAASDINSGKVLGIGEYDYNYFPILSTAILGYTLYLIIKFCIDIALRGFKLGFLQMIAPLAVADYITGGAEEGTFKQWLQACKGTYLMFFVRVLSLWFIVFVVSLMNKKGDISESLLYIPKGGEPDYLLRAVIIIALLAFMMELPKLLSDIFGLDLEGDSTVKGLMKSVAGGVTKVAGAGLAMGGAALGGLAGASKGVAMGLANKDKKQVLSALGGSAGGVLKAGLGQTSLGGALVGGVSGGYGANVNAATKAHVETKEKDAKEQAAVEKQQAADEKKQEIARQEENRRQDLATAAENRRQDILRDDVKSQVSNNPGAKKEEIIESVIQTQINAKLGDVDLDGIPTEISTSLKGIQDVNGNIQSQDVVQTVHQVLGNKLDVTQDQVEQVVNRIMGNDNISTSVEQVEQVVNQVINTSKDNMKQEVTQVVNQVMGTVVDAKVEDATRTINETEGTKLRDETEEKTKVVNEVKGTEVDDYGDDIERLVYEQNVQKKEKKSSDKKSESLFD